MRHGPEGQQLGSGVEHPLDAGEGKVAALGDLGFNRLSVGVQSFDDRVLASLGRAHTGAAARTAIERCLATGATVSLDLISAVEGQDLGSDLAGQITAGKFLARFTEGPKGQLAQNIRTEGPPDNPEPPSAATSCT